MKLKSEEDREFATPIERGMIVRPVVFFSEWLGVVLTDPKQYEPSREDDEMMIYAPGAHSAPSFQWDGVYVVDVYWFTEGERTEEFVDFLEIVSPPQDEYDDPDYLAKKWEFDWTSGNE